MALAKLHPDNTVNTADLAKAYPKYKIPFELLTLSLPELSGYTDTLIVLWYLRKAERVRTGAVNVMLIALDENQELSYFIDRNNNQNLADDGSPYLFKEGEQQRQVNIEDRRIGTLSFMLQNLEAAIAAPVQPESLHKDIASVPESPVLTREREAFALHFISSLSSGGGKASLNYREMPRPDSDEEDKKYTYGASYYASFNTTIGVAASLYNFYVGVSGSVEMFEVGEQHLIKEFNKRGEAFRQVQPNTGYWPSKRINLSGFIEYDFLIGSSLRFAPTLSYTRYNFIESHSFVYNGERDINQYFTDRYSYSFGGKIKYSVTEKSLLFFEVFKRYNHFDGSSYFPNIEPETFSMKFNQLYGGIGFQLKLTSLN
ncbi:hypothetical protein [Pontibacter pamirensis]|uniref:hypothetical protein n=1 Tax=Pontibacter pamirensis TaxID=2562824 RepID=UPI00138A467B|nr:hypothetical protein [Pontibacter pamirensis]